MSYYTRGLGRMQGLEFSVATRFPRFHDEDKSRYLDPGGEVSLRDREDWLAGFAEGIAAMAAERQDDG